MHPWPLCVFAFALDASANVYVSVGPVPKVRGGENATITANSSTLKKRK